MKFDLEKVIKYVCSAAEKIGTDEFNGDTIVHFHVPHITPQVITHLDTFGLHLLNIQAGNKKTIRVAFTMNRIEVDGS